MHNSDKTVDEGITSIKSSLTHPTATKLTNESVFKKLKKLEDPDAIIEYLQLLIMRLGPTGRYLPKTIEQITREKGYIVLLDIIYDENFASHTEIRKAANQAMTLYLDQIQLMQQSALSVSIMLYDILQYYLNAEKSDALYPTLQVIRKTITRMKRDKFRNISVDFHRNKGDEKLLLVIEKYANTTRSDVANKTMVSQQSISDEKAGNDLPSVEHNAEEISQDIRETVHEMLAKLSKIAHPQQTEIEILDNLFTRLKGRSALSTAIEIATDQGYLHIINFIRNISLSSELSLAVVRRASEIYSLWIDVMKMTNAHNQFNAFVQILNYLVQIKQNRHIKLLEQVITVTMEATKDYLNHYPSFQLRFEQEHGMDKLKKLKGMILQGNNHNIIVSSSETYQIK